MLSYIGTTVCLIYYNNRLNKEIDNFHWLRTTLYENHIPYFLAKTFPVRLDLLSQVSVAP